MPVLNWEDFLFVGQTRPRQPVAPKPDDISTIMYTRCEVEAVAVTVAVAVAVMRLTRAPWQPASALAWSSAQYSSRVSACQAARRLCVLGRGRSRLHILY